MTWIVLCAALAGVVTLVALVCDRWVEHAGRGRLFRPGETPDVDAMLVLGTSPVGRRGAPNRYFEKRMDAAMALWRTGALRWIVVSGAAGGTGGDEPRAMREALVRRGAPPSAIYRDPHGVRTLDSVLRAREVFGARRLVVVSQAFHARRALWIARRHGVEAWMWPAADVTAAGGIRTRLREVGARARAVFDAVRRTRPSRLDPPVRMGVDASD